MLQQARRANLAEAGKPAPVAREGIRISRRGFLKAAVAGGAGLALNGTRRAPVAAAQYADRSKPRIAIVGAGIAGLNAAYQLKRAGYAATVYEARSRLGGRIQSATGLIGRGLTTDLGGAFINSDHEDILALVDDFGLELFNRAEDAERFDLPATAYLFDGRSYSEADVAELLRPLAAQISADAELLDDDFEANAPAFDAISVAQYLARHNDKIPAPFIRRLIENTIRTEYGVEPQYSSALQLLFLLPTVDGESVELLGSSDELFVVKGGADQIIGGLRKALEGQIRTRQRLTGLEQRGNGYRLTFNRKDTVEADYVILAVPFPVLRKVPLAVELPETLRAFIDEAQLGRNEKLFVGMREKAWRQADGFTLDGWSDIGFSSLWEETQRQPERTDGALTLLFGANDVDALARTSAVLQGRRLMEQLDGTLPGVRGAISQRFFRTFWHQTFFTGGGYTSFRPGQYSAFAEHLYIEADDPDERQDVHVGNLVFAGEHLSDAYYGYMNGGAETGRLAAELVARLIAEVGAGAGTRRMSVAAAGR
jgi:monoamine oxidase